MDRPSHRFLLSICATDPLHGLLRVPGLAAVDSVQPRAVLLLVVVKRGFVVNGMYLLYIWQHLQAVIILVSVVASSVIDYSKVLKHRIWAVAPLMLASLYALTLDANAFTSNAPQPHSAPQSSFLPLPLPSVVSLSASLLHPPLPLPSAVSPSPSPSPSVVRHIAVISAAGNGNLGITRRSMRGGPC